MTTTREGPGLAKVRKVRLVRRRSLGLVALLDAPIAALLAAADIVAEGHVTDDANGPRFFGSADMLVRLESGDPAEAAVILALDPHVRVRALRIARREASMRADAPLGTMRAELSVTAATGAVRIHVEIDADVIRAPQKRTLVP